MSNLEDIYSALGIRPTGDQLADALAAVADGHVRRAQREAAASLADKAEAEHLAALRARAEADPMALTVAEASELDRADRFTARAEQEATARAAVAEDSRRRLAGGKGTAAAQYRAAYTDWLAGNGAGHGIPAPQPGDFIDE